MEKYTLIQNELRCRTEWALVKLWPCGTKLFISPRLLQTGTETLELVKTKFKNFIKIP